MTKNAYLFMWDQYGIEAIVPISQYEDQQKLDLIAVLCGKPVGHNPLFHIINHMILRARYNPERRYEIYAIDCDENITLDALEESWKDNPQAMANLIREKGVSLFSETHRDISRPIVIK
jgi:hypothetical protein